MSQFRQKGSGRTLIGSSAIAVALALASCSQPSGQAPATSAPTPASGPAASVQAARPAAVLSFGQFNGSVPTTLTNNQCSLDNINGQPAGNPSPVAAGSTITFSGWAGNGRGQSASEFVLLLKGAQQSYSLPLTLNFPRPDVAKALKSAAMEQSGLNLNARLSGVRQGTYSIYFADPAHPLADCDTRRALLVQ